MDPRSTAPSLAPTVRSGNVDRDSLSSNCVHLKSCWIVNNGVKQMYTKDEHLTTPWSIVTSIQSWRPRRGANVVNFTTARLF